MSEEKNTFFPYHDIEDVIGEIVSVKPMCPGVYYMIAKKPEAPAAGEYYAVEKDSPCISSMAKTYGRQLAGRPELVLYAFSEGRSGSGIIDYEIGKYLVANHLPLPDNDSLHSIAVFQADNYPEYFGTYPVPIHTPRGFTLRWRKLINGVYWLETDQVKHFLAVCYPIWSVDLSEYVVKLAEQTDYDKSHGMEETLGHLFFSMRDGCLVLSELLPVYKELAQSDMLDMAALENAIWAYHPRYAVLHNMREQTGQNDLLHNLLASLGLIDEPNIVEDGMLAISPAAGSDYLRI